MRGIFNFDMVLLNTIPGNETVEGIAKSKAERPLSRDLRQAPMTVPRQSHTALPRDDQNMIVWPNPDDWKGGGEVSSGKKFQ